jgi:LysM repeat protein
MQASVRSRMRPVAGLAAMLLLAGCGSAATPSPSPVDTPAPSVEAPATPEPTAAEVAPTTPPEMYRVRKGDTLAEIAASHSITLKALRAANPEVTDPRLLRIGQKLVIPSP